MEIEYNNFDFELEFEEEVFTDKYPAFVLRSILGNELKKFSCILKNKNCEECPLKFQCAYSFVFETPIKKENEVLMGRDKATHPFTIHSMVDINKNIKYLNFSLSLFGRGIEYFPYIYYSFMRAAENGMFRQRIPYKINRIMSDNFVVNDGGSEVLNLPERKLWTLDREIQTSKKKIKIDLLT
ncbi:MAG: CRISPR-associated protein Cas6, partial [Calditerrivibrio sp.]|nr:CRISPR-associated protein Cas6 [Calditerrivibrio sp.]